MIFPISRSNEIIFAAYFLSFSSLILRSSFITLFSASIGVCGALKATYRTRQVDCVIVKGKTDIYNIAYKIKKISSFVSKLIILCFT